MINVQQFWFRYLNLQSYITITLSKCKHAYMNYMKVYAYMWMYIFACVSMWGAEGRGMCGTFSLYACFCDSV